jgi:hypothetical protein
MVQDDVRTRMCGKEVVLHLQHALHAEQIIVRQAAVPSMIIPHNTSQYKM